MPFLLDENLSNKFGHEFGATGKNLERLAFGKPHLNDPSVELNN